MVKKFKFKLFDRVCKLFIVVDSILEVLFPIKHIVDLTLDFLKHFVEKLRV